jgi:hypothetical protein
MKKTAIIIIVSLLITAAISAGCTDKSVASTASIKIAANIPVDTFGKPLVVGVPTLTKIDPVTYIGECLVLQKDGTTRKCNGPEGAGARNRYAVELNRIYR